MKFGEVFDYRNAEEAKEYIGKKGVFSDILKNITELPEGFAPCILMEIAAGASSPFIDEDKDIYQFFRPVLEDEELMTNRQLAEWLAKGNGEYALNIASMVFSDKSYSKADGDCLVHDGILIRRWNDTEWSKPTRAIYEEDCK